MQYYIINKKRPAIMRGGTTTADTIWMIQQECRYGIVRHELLVDYTEEWWPIMLCPLPLNWDTPRELFFAQALSTKFLPVWQRETRWLAAVILKGT